MFKNYQYYIDQHDNPSLLYATFFHNILHHKTIFMKWESASLFYNKLLEYDVGVNLNHGQTD